MPKTTEQIPPLPTDGKHTLRVRTGTKLMVDQKWYAVVRVMFYEANGTVTKDDEYMDPQPFETQDEALARARAAAIPKLREIQAANPSLTVQGMPK